MYSRMIPFYIYIYNILFHILFHYRLLRDIEHSSLYYMADSYWLPILYVVVCIYQSQSPNLSLSFFFPLGNIGLFSTSVTQFLFCK